MMAVIFAICVSMGSGKVSQTQEQSARRLEKYKQSKENSKIPVPFPNVRFLHGSSPSTHATEQLRLVHIGKPGPDISLGFVANV